MNRPHLTPFREWSPVLAVGWGTVVFTAAIGFYINLATGGPLAPETRAIVSRHPILFVIIPSALVLEDDVVVG
jgi:hypothetical protein